MDLNDHRRSRRGPSRPVTRAALVLSLLAGAASAAADDPFGQLMRQLAERPHGHAAFVERQFVSLLKQPVESSGELFFDAPDHLEKRTLLPRPESLVVDKGMLTIQRGARHYSVALRTYPQMGPFIDSIRATLAGDRAALESVYGIDFELTDHGWVLTLTPRDPKLAAVVRNIRIVGSGDLIQSVETTRADGDRSVMNITALAGS